MLPCFPCRHFDVSVCEVEPSTGSVSETSGDAVAGAFRDGEGEGVAFKRFLIGFIEGIASHCDIRFVDFVMGFDDFVMLSSSEA